MEENTSWSAETIIIIVLFLIIIVPCAYFMINCLVIQPIYLRLTKKKKKTYLLFGTYPPEDYNSFDDDLSDWVHKDFTKGIIRDNKFASVGFDIRSRVFWKDNYGDDWKKDPESIVGKLVVYNFDAGNYIDTFPHRTCTRRDFQGKLLRKVIGSFNVEKSRAECTDSEIVKRLHETLSNTFSDVNTNNNNFNDILMLYPEEKDFFIGFFITTLGNYNFTLVPYSQVVSFIEN